MPIIFISLHGDFVQKIKRHGYKSYNMRIETYKPQRKTYYVSPANSYGFMDGGIDLALSDKIFSGIQKYVYAAYNKYGKTNLVGKKYLPIGSSIILPGLGTPQKLLVVSPTMWLPQNVSKTQNAYYATMAVLYNVLVVNKENINKVDIIFTSMCCGYGKMSVDDSIQQILNGIRDYKHYKPSVVNKYVVIHEPNMDEQPNYYQNTAWKDISDDKIEKYYG